MQYDAKEEHGSVLYRLCREKVVHYKTSDIPLVQYGKCLEKELALKLNRPRI
jgi:hypothetical protein